MSTKKNYYFKFLKFKKYYFKKILFKWDYYFLFLFPKIWSLEEFETAFNPFINVDGSVLVFVSKTA